jgi:hypothetical protein
MLLLAFSFRADLVAVPCMTAELALLFMILEWMLLCRKALGTFRDGFIDLGCMTHIHIFMAQVQR